MAFVVSISRCQGAPEKCAISAFTKRDASSRDFRYYAPVGRIHSLQSKFLFLVYVCNFMAIKCAKNREKNLRAQGSRPLLLMHHHCPNSPTMDDSLLLSPLQHGYISQKRHESTSDNKITRNGSVPVAHIPQQPNVSLASSVIFRGRCTLTHEEVSLPRVSNFMTGPPSRAVVSSVIP